MEYAKLILELLLAILPFAIISALIVIPGVMLLKRFAPKIYYLIFEEDK